MVKVDKLRDAMSAKDISVKDAANALKVDPATLYRRFNGEGEDFTVREVGILAKMLNLSSRRMQDIFFAD